MQSHGAHDGRKQRRRRQTLGFFTVFLWIIHHVTFTAFKVTILNSKPRCNLPCRACFTWGCHVVCEKATCSNNNKLGAHWNHDCHYNHNTHTTESFVIHFCLFQIKLQFTFLTCNTSSDILNIHASESCFVLYHDKAVFHLQTVKTVQ